ncbi:DUF5130 family protein [Actinomycetospora soli]|uniref:DUF5130 family protein n=1 Tax=Actinomycetospora soli TaxID=2893887 RepID=UPI001E5E72E9|nr:DUF5130 family protein [Actinomycetospora soli]MCD2186875.1 DUF5130 domain-containing protein [Actinomycetospora soli]
MAPGEVARPQARPGETPMINETGLIEDPVYGHARVPTASGRISEATEILADDQRVPFSSSQLSRIDEALTRTSAETGLLFSVWVGELGPRSRERAEELHAALGEQADEAVLIAVSPGERVVEVVTGEESVRRVDDRGAKLGVMAMVSSFTESDLVGGIVEGLRVLGDHAGSKH